MKAVLLLISSLLAISTASSLDEDVHGEQIIPFLQGFKELDDAARALARLMSHSPQLWISMVVGTEDKYKKEVMDKYGWVDGEGFQRNFWNMIADIKKLRLQMNKFGWEKELQ